MGIDWDHSDPELCNQKGFHLEPGGAQLMEQEVCGEHQIRAHILEHPPHPSYVEALLLIHE